MAGAREKSLWDGIFPYKNEPFTLWTFFTIKDNSGLKLQICNLLKAWEATFNYALRVVHSL